MQIAVFTNIEDMERRNAHAQALMHWAPVPLGDLFRAHAYSYPAFGMILTPSNVAEIISRSKMAYSAEWAESDESVNLMIAEACQSAGLLDANEILNMKIAEYAAGHILSSIGNFHGPSVFRIKDIGGGAGGTSAALLKELLKYKLKCKIVIDLALIDPSESRMATALSAISNLIKNTYLEGLLNINPITGTVDALKGMVGDDTDLVISNAAIHHESFNEHLTQILCSLKPGSPFISGDWHESNYESPAKVYWIYYLLQDPFDEKTLASVVDFVLGKSSFLPKKERAELKEFRELFGLDKQAVRRAFDGLTEDERRANVGGMKYWIEIGKRFAKEGKKSPEVLIQCHERVSKRTEALTNAGFVFDDECRSKYVKLLSGRGYGELTAVMLAKKSR